MPSIKMKESCMKSFFIFLFAFSLIFPFGKGVEAQNTPASTEIVQMKATVVKVAGDVRIRNRGTIFWHDAKVNEILGAGDQIETKKDGKIEIKLENDNVIILKPNTKLILRKLTIDLKTGDYENLLESNIGKIRAKVERIKGNSKFEIKTPTAVACVRGTIIYLLVYPDSTMAFFEEGVGFITNPFLEQTFDVEPGYVYQIDENGNVTGPVIPTDEQLQDIIKGWSVEPGGEGYSDPGGGDDGLGDDVNDLTEGQGDSQNEAQNDKQNSQNTELTQYAGLLGGTGMTGGTSTGGTGTATGTDTDNDGITDLAEVTIWNTDPFVPDVDADTDHIPDIEDAFFNSPNLDETTPDIYGSRDRIREEIKEIIARNNLRDEIQDMINDTEIRHLDAAMDQVVDAQTGKVLRDRQGYRVRIEQYVLRPDSYTVQLLNVNLRTQEAGSLSGLNTLDWTTRFSQSIDNLTGQQLRNLPWNDYLLGNPVEHGSIRPTYYPDWTQVRFDNSQGNAFMEKKDFSVLTDVGCRTFHNWQQSILWDKVSFDCGSTWYSFTTSNISGGNNPDGFRITPYSLDTSYNVDIRFYIISDSGTLVNSDGKAFDSIWGFLAVNMPKASNESIRRVNKRNIGDNNLEIRLSSKFGGTTFRDIDLIYVPWDRQNWSNDHSWGSGSYIEVFQK